MSERFFDITDSDFGKQMKEYYDYFDKVNKLVWEFVEEAGIETRNCSWLGDVFFINPTDKDLSSFESQLKKENDRGNRAFKLNSVIGKTWKNKLKENDINKERMTRPQPQMFDIWKVCKYGEDHHSSTLNYEDRFYWSITGTNDEKLDESKGYLEILGSEFHRINELID